MKNSKTKFKNLYVGQKASITKIITFDLIETFSNVSSDFNPIHLDKNIAKDSIFGKRVAHGMLIASFISALIGNKLPGNGSIYLGQNLSFKLPVYIDNTIKTEVIITSLVQKKRLIHLDTFCYNQNNEIVISGNAIVKLS